MKICCNKASTFSIYFCSQILPDPLVNDIHSAIIRGNSSPFLERSGKRRKPLILKIKYQLIIGSEGRYETLDSLFLNSIRLSINSTRSYQTHLVALR